MPSIFDLVQSNEIAAYWSELTQDRAPYLGETLFQIARNLDLT